LHNLILDDRYPLLVGVLAECATYSSRTQEHSQLVGIFCMIKEFYEPTRKNKKKLTFKDLEKSVSKPKTIVIAGIVYANPALEDRKADFGQ
jgi:hypothetical protein